MAVNPAGSKNRESAETATKHSELPWATRLWAQPGPKNTYLRERYYRLAARRGKQRAIVAIEDLEPITFVTSDRAVLRLLGQV